MEKETKVDYAAKTLKLQGYDEQFIKDWKYMVETIDADLRDFIDDYEECGKDIVWLTKSIHDACETCYYDSLC